ncbi:MAG: hypothetical protein AAFY66_07860 [Pseudomonadota bacterium]
MSRGFTLMGFRLLSPARQFGFILAVVLTLMVSHTAEATLATTPKDGLPTLEEVLVARNAGDHTALEEAFDRLEDALNSGVITSERYRRPWLAFGTGYGPHWDVMQDWAEAFPASPHPHAAQGIGSRYIARIFRGGASNRLTPEGALQLARESFRDAAEHFSEALARSPRHFAAARGLHALAPRGYRTRFTGYAGEVVARQMGKLDLMVSTVFDRLPQWGGSVEEVIAYCSEAAAGADGELTSDECLAVALTVGPSPRSKMEAFRRLQEAGEERFLFPVSLGILHQRNQAVTDAFIARTGYIFSPRQLVDLQVGHDELRRQFEFWDQIDGGNPFLMHVAGRVAAQRGDLGRAFQLFEHSFQIYPYDYKIHRDRLRLFIMLRQSPKVLPAMETAIETLEGQAEAIIPSMIKVLDNVDAFSFDADGTRHSRYSCRLTSLVEAIEAWCPAREGILSYCAVADTRPAQNLDAQLRRNRAIWQNGTESVRKTCAGK